MQRILTRQATPTGLIERDKGREKDVHFACQVNTCSLRVDVLPQVNTCPG